MPDKETARQIAESYTSRARSEYRPHKKNRRSTIRGIRLKS